ncbi:hypothetical protein GCM10010521_39280 [Streptomyces rameus]|uniref:Uncharacterized protein n=1 Tax=Streptomyces rameus TaxID=68261 RepID=A0ABP6NIU5_9ACTN
MEAVLVAAAAVVAPAASAAWAGAASAARAATDTAVAEMRRAQGRVVIVGVLSRPYVMSVRGRNVRGMILGESGARGTVGLLEGRCLEVCVTFLRAPVSVAGDKRHRRNVRY